MSDTLNHEHLSVIYLPGMQGEMPGDRWFVRGLQQAGVENARIYDWPGRMWMLHNLRDREQHQSAAAQLNQQMAAMRAENPRSRLVLIGHSTGAMVIFDALGQAEGCGVEQVWLLAAAVSCEFDLKPVMARVQRMVNVHSSLDWLVLNIGTRLFGTADGLHERAAGGIDGFIGPGHDHASLEQWNYDARWLKQGHYGGHLGPLGSPFARKVIGPAILAYHPAEAAS